MCDGDRSRTSVAMQDQRRRGDARERARARRLRRSPRSTARAMLGDGARFPARSHQRRNASSSRHARRRSARSTSKPCSTASGSSRDRAARIVAGHGRRRSGSRAPTVARAAPFTITRLRTRSGWSAASTSPVMPVEPDPKIVACSHPTASITAMASSAQNSGPDRVDRAECATKHPFRAGRTGSPWQNEARRRWKRYSDGSASIESIGMNGPGRTTRSTGPSPRTW